MLPGFILGLNACRSGACVESVGKSRSGFIGACNVSTEPPGCGDDALPSGEEERELLGGGGLGWPLYCEVVDR